MPIILFKYIRRIDYDGKGNQVRCADALHFNECKNLCNLTSGTIGTTGNQS